MIPCFTLQLRHTITPNIVAIGTYDGVNPQLTCGTSSGKIFLHNPRDSEKPVKFLNIHKDITCICTGSREDGKDVLFIGTENHLQCYDIENNCDVFFLEIQDSVTCLLYDEFASSTPSGSPRDGDEIESKNGPLIFVGGNCALTGYDLKEANEEYWNTPGGNVVSMMMHCSKLYVSADDFNVYIYDRSERMIKELYMSQVVTQMISLDTSGSDKTNTNERKSFSSFAFALRDGTFGVVGPDDEVLWKKKSENKVLCLNAYDFDGNGTMDLLLGYNTGLLEIRSAFPKSSAGGTSLPKKEGGQVLYKDKVSSVPICAILIHDYKQVGNPQIVIATQKGVVKGFLPQQVNRQIKSTNNVDDEMERLKVRHVYLEKEIRNYEENMKTLTGRADPSLIPHDTGIECRLKPNPQQNSVDIVFESQKETLIHLAILEADHLFEGENNRRLFYVEREKQASSISIGLRPPKDLSISLHAKVFVGKSLMSERFHVFEIKFPLPRFSMYIPIRKVPEGATPRGFVEFRFSSDRTPQEVVEWLNHSFNIVYTKDRIKILPFLSLRDGKCVVFTMSDNNNTIRFQTDDIQLAGDLIQDICTHMGVKELESRGHFPDLFETIKVLLVRMGELNGLRLSLFTDMADVSLGVRALIVQLEDCRVNLMDMRGMREKMINLMDMNKDLFVEFTRRKKNQDDLLACLKKVNHLINQASRLRVGRAKQKVIRDCRTAIKKNNSNMFLKVIEYGKS